MGIFFYALEKLKTAMVKDESKNVQTTPPAPTASAIALALIFVCENYWLITGFSYFYNVFGFHYSDPVMYMHFLYFIYDIPYIP